MITTKTAITKLGIGNIDTKTGRSVIQRLWDAVLNFIQSIVGDKITIEENDSEDDDCLPRFMYKMLEQSK
jgi:hypothetical protein